VIVDLTMDVCEHTPQFPGDLPFESTAMATIAAQGWNARRVSFNSHFSTHVDAPFHMLGGGRKLDEFPVESFIGRARVIGVRGRTRIGRDCLPPGRLPTMVLFRTGHSKRRQEKDYFSSNPVLDEAVASELVGRGVRLVGIDSFTVDNAPYAVHQIFFDADVLILENLVNLERLGGECRLIVAPLALRQADGAPARVFAEVTA
jgi:arylformamidase